LLQQYYADQEQADDYVKNNQEIDHGDCFGTSKCGMRRYHAERRNNPAKSLDWCGGGDLNPYALRR
jgi:hypothetical protein